MLSMLTKPMPVRVTVQFEDVEAVESLLAIQPQKAGFSLAWSSCSSPHPIPFWWGRTAVRYPR
jgi:hypothetical protein